MKILLSLSGIVAIGWGCDSPGTSGRGGVGSPPVATTNDTRDRPDAFDVSTAPPDAATNDPAPVDTSGTCPPQGCGCVPNCGARECGNDGCGGVCGICQSDEACVQGTCTCVPDCAGRSCGPDGCGGECGRCAGGDACGAEGKCACEPDCDGRECGSDGCGGSCGECGDWACDDGVCTCVPQCDGRECGPDGCGASCGGCGAGNCTFDGVCTSDRCGDDACEPTEVGSCSADCPSRCDGACDLLSDILYGCVKDCMPVRVCDNGTCEFGEFFETCPEDCASGCGDLYCEDGEQCPEDCAECGDHVCLSGEVLSCPNDCLVFTP